MSEKSIATQRATARRSLKAEDVMQQPVIAATPRASLRDVATQLVVNEFSGMPVADADGRVVGVVTEADIVRGRLLEALARLFAQNVRIYAYPMAAAELRERLKGVAAAGWEWSETNGMVSAAQLRRAPPLGHLFDYLLASNFLVPMQVPASLKADA